MHILVIASDSIKAELSQKRLCFTMINLINLTQLIIFLVLPKPKIEICLLFCSNPVSISLRTFINLCVFEMKFAITLWIGDIAISFSENYRIVNKEIAINIDENRS